MTVPAEDFGELLNRLAERDSQVWDWLSRETGRFARRTAKRHRMNDTDADDLAQAVRLTLVEHVPDLREPACLRGWLATTFDRQACRTRSRRGREMLVPRLEDRRLPAALSPELAALTEERDRALWRAAVRLPSAKARQLVWLLAYRPELTHAELAAELDLAPGSVGPLRRRSLDAMRKRLLADGFDASDTP